MTNAPSGTPTVSVVIATFTKERWNQLTHCVESVQRQTAPPLEIIVAVDHNDELFAQCEEHWKDSGSSVPVRVIASQEHTAPDEYRTSPQRTQSGRPHGGGGTRGAGALVASGDVVAFIDDDAWAEPDWLEHLLAPFSDPNVVAVGGKPVPEAEGSVPRWYPMSFYWIFGCAYEGLPTSLAPTTRLIGANMSLRATAFKDLGGFQTVDLEDLFVCARLSHEYPTSAVLYEPRAVVHHWVPRHRTTWRYFYRRCFFVNREKVRTFELLGTAASFRPELVFVGSVLAGHTVSSVRRFVRGDFWAVPQLFVTYLGVTFAGLGNLCGVVLYRIIRRPSGFSR